jgi:hypothetical protein
VRRGSGNTRSLSLPSLRHGKYAFSNDLRSSSVAGTRALWTTGDRTDIVAPNISPSWPNTDLSVRRLQREIRDKDVPSSKPQWIMGRLTTAWGRRRMKEARASGCKATPLSTNRMGDRNC